MEDMAIKPLAFKKRKGEAHGVKQWVQLLEPLMGDETRKLYEHMECGEKILLQEKFFGPKTYRMATIQQEMLDLGMDRESLEEGFVRGLKEASRAEKVGLKEGDRIVKSSHVWKSVDDFEAEMKVIVEHDGIQKRAAYRPRSMETVECLKFVKTED
jgi:predicted metalloprotease with PDZ domain